MASEDRTKLFSILLVWSEAFQVFASTADSAGLRGTVRGPAGAKASRAGSPNHCG
jgi:hypothetical protein